MSMVKIIDPSGWNWDRPVAVMVKISSMGLRGHDRSDFIKVAGHQFIHLIDNLKVAKDEVPVHTIALGASEAYSYNRNGDGFKEATCRKCHDSFVKHARWYRNHQNRDQAKSYGYIKSSAYNETMRRVELLAMLNATKEAADRNGGLVADKELTKLARHEDLSVSMACLLDPEYPILTRDRGYVGIQHIKVGDLVWTHAGNWKRVKQLNRRPYTGEVFKFALNGLPLPLELTADHPMLAKVFAGSCEIAAMQSKASRYFKDAAEFNQHAPAWTAASEIGVGDRFFYRPITRYQGYGKIANIDLAAVMGYYTAEGSFTYNGDKAAATQFTCNLDDSLPRQLPLLMERMFPDITVSISPHPGSAAALVVNVIHTGFSEMLRKLVGRGCKRKMIPPEIFNADEDIKLAFLGAWLDGDGWLDGKGVHWSTTGLNLVLQGRDLLASIGVPASIYKIDHANCETSGHAGSGIEYILNVAHLESWRLSPYSAKVADYVVKKAALRTKPATMRLCPDGSYAMRIKAVETRFITDQITYNFEVEDDESYSAAGLISHNCKIGFDVCGGCGNKARTRDEYCDERTCKRGGCKHNLTKIAEDGFVLGVDNPDPHWFDLSDVFKPADRIAYGTRADYLEKAAGHGFMGGAELAEALGVTAPLAVCMASDNPFAWNDQLRGQYKLAHALARAEQAFSSLPVRESAFRAFDPAVQPRLTTDQMMVLGIAGTEKSAAVLDAMAQHKMILPLRDFAAWTGKSASADAALSVLPRIYTRLVESGRLEPMLNNNPFVCSGKSASVAQQSLVWNLAPGYSLAEDAVNERVMRSSLRTAADMNLNSGIEIEKTASEDRDAVDLAEAYALYKLAALHRMAGFDQRFMLTATLAVGQNRIC